MARISGLYVIRNLNTGGFYVGSSTSIARRENEHLKDLLAGRHCNRRLQRSWNKHGSAAFEWVTLAYLERDELKPTEQRLLDRVVGTYGCYNIAIDARSGMRGRKASAETCRKLSAVPRTAEWRANSSAARKGRKEDPAVTERRIAKLRGRKLSHEHVARVVAKTTGKKRSPEFCKAVRERMAGMPGPVHTPETRRRQSEGLRSSAKFRAAMDRRIGVKMPPEVVAKSVASRRGLKRSPESCARIAASQRGKSPSPESNEKRRATWARKRLEKQQQQQAVA